MKKIGLICLSAMLLLLTGCGNKYDKLEKDLTTKASKYYEDNLEGKVLGITQHKIDLTAMEKAKIDIKEFTDEDCNKDSYALIILKLDKDNKVVGDYKVENHLTCGDYKTTNK
jgi:hypothetical protein